MTDGWPGAAAAGNAGAVAVRRARAAGCLLGGAIPAAPFLALLYDPAAGLGVMALALGAVAAAANAARSDAVDPVQRARLRLAAGLNAALAVACVAALLARLR